MILILGARGFVGSAFCAACAEAGLEFRGVDLDDYDGARGARCDVLINADGNSKKYLAEEDPARDFRLSVLSVMDSISDFDFRRYLHISSVAVYPDPSDPRHTAEDAVLDPAAQSRYGFHKRLAEELVVKYCPDWLILRLGGMVGEGLRKGPVHDILTGAPLWVGTGSRFQFIHTRDVARIALRMLVEGCTQEIFNVWGRGTVTLAEVRGRAGLAGENDLPAEVWDVNTDKAHRRFGLPSTEDTVRAFIDGRRP
ncbi:MAG: NAD-dependent epimerase/dehydratase family protein [Candidatus Aureabacteria bacterium]|nr:NAD-dependent epimerase/dehydratase family protein [Candidatus Auribacterota bacterium]